MKRAKAGTASGNSFLIHLLQCPPAPDSSGDRCFYFEEITYLREPRFRFFKRVWRIFAFLRFGLLMMKVPLPMYSDL
jgi:hypothetical protein